MINFFISHLPENKSTVIKIYSIRFNLLLIAFIFFSNNTVQTAKASTNNQVKTHVVVSEFKFEGNTVLTSEQLGEIAEAYRGRPVSSAELEDLRIRLTEFYTDAGYINSGALLPSQTVVDGGTVLYQIREGVLSEISVEGQGRLHSDYVKNYIYDGIAQPLNRNDLQNAFQLEYKKNKPPITSKPTHKNTYNQNTFTVRRLPIFHPPTV